MLAYSNSTIAALKILEALNENHGKSFSLSEIFNAVEKNDGELFFDSNMNPMELMTFLQDVNLIRAHQNGVLKYSITDFGIEHFDKLKSSISIKPEVQSVK